nr:retrovirus-related Pol polyprotein from transposon TNT 1-94 [Tanacetum cinerariifolium]
MEIVGVGVGYLLGKRGGKRAQGFGGKNCAVHSVLKRDRGDRDGGLIFFELSSLWLNRTCNGSPFGLMTMQQVQVNTKFLNALSLEWSKFVTDVKLAKILYTTNYDQLYAYFSQHERHANEIRITRERYSDPLALVANSSILYNPSQSPQHSKHRPILKIKQPFKMVESQFNKFKDDKLRVMLVLETEELLLLQREILQLKIPQNSALHTKDLDAYDSNCDDISSAKAVLMHVQEMQYSEQTHIDDFQDNEIHNDSNIILYSRYLQESQDVVIQDTNSSAPNDLLVLSLVKQMTNHIAHLDKENQTNKMFNESLTAELKRYKKRVTIFEQRLNIDLNKCEKLIDSQMDDLIRNRNAKLADF